MYTYTFCCYCISLYFVSLFFLFISYHTTINSKTFRTSISPSASVHSLHLFPLLWLVHTIALSLSLLSVSVVTIALNKSTHPRHTIRSLIRKNGGTFCSSVTGIIKRFQCIVCEKHRRKPFSDTPPFAISTSRCTSKFAINSSAS